MDTEVAREQLYKIYPELVFERGLTQNEGLAFGLMRVIGLSRKETASFMSELTKSNVTPNAVSHYDYTAKVKMGHFESDSN